jgi:hypothetical protein
MEPDVRRIHLKDPEASREPAEVPVPGWVRFAGWFVPPIFLGVVLGTLVLLRRGPDEFFITILAVTVSMPVVWGLVSLFFPAYADRRCPECNELALESMDVDSPTGLECGACGYVDETAGAWKFAEERDAPLEPMVLKSRQSR